MRWTFLAVSLPATLACAGVFDPVPMEGDYEVTASNVEVSASCADEWGLGEESGTETVAVLIREDEVEFVDYVTCARTFASFECDDNSAIPGSSSNATLKLHTEGEGRWTTPSTFEASLSMVASCSGRSCPEGLGSCTMFWDWAGTSEP